MALGILPPHTFIADIFTVDLPINGHACLFSDGLIEQYTHEERPFGIDKLKALFINLSRWPYPLFEWKYAWILLCWKYCRWYYDLHFRFRETKQLASKSRSQPSAIYYGRWVLLGCQHRRTYVTQRWLFKLVKSILSIFGFCHSFLPTGFTVVAELFSNAIDHGVLKLDSRLKNDQKASNCTIVLGTVCWQTYIKRLGESEALSGAHRKMSYI